MSLCSIYTKVYFPIGKTTYEEQEKKKEWKISDIETNGRKFEKINNKLNVRIYEDISVTIGNSNKLKNNIFQKLGGKKWV